MVGTRVVVQRNVVVMGCIAAIALAGLTGCGGGSAPTGSAAGSNDTTADVLPSTSVVAASTSSSSSRPTVSPSRPTEASSPSLRSPATTITGEAPDSVVTVIRGTTQTVVPVTPPQQPTTTQKPRARPPGAPGSVIIDSRFTPIVARWYETLVKGVDQAGGRPACQELLTDVKTSGRLQDSSPSIAAYAQLYLGTAEGCLGMSETRKDLESARKLLQGLTSLDKYNRDSTCQPEKLVVWAYDTFLHEAISVSCIPE